MKSIRCLVLSLVCLLTCSLARAQDINLTGYTMTFDDEFNTLSATTTSPKGASNWYAGPPNGSAGDFSSSNWNISSFSAAGGILSCTAYYASPAINGQNWQSGLLASVDPTGAGFSQKYGYFECRCQMPNAGEGAWPAFWLDSTSGITGGQNEEIDIFEWYGVCNTPGSDQDYASQASHNWESNGTQDSSQPSLYAPQTPLPDGQYPWQGYHIYGCQVDPVHITWYIDGVQTNQIATPTSYITSPFYVMLDYALGGGWPLSGTPFTTNGSSAFQADWVRVYALPSAPTTNSIGIQFQGSGTALPSTASAGLSTVAQANWNVATGASFSSLALHDSTAASTTAKLSGTAGGGYFAGGSSASPSGNADLASGELYNTWPGGSALTVSSIPYSTYDVYLYAAIDATGRNETMGLTPSGGTAQYFSFLTEGGGSAWTAATSTWNGSGTAPSLPSANYVHFSGLTGSSFTLAWGAPGNGGLNGIQIVPVQVNSIGVQFQGDGTALAATDSAGLAGVAATHWNVLAASTFSSVTLSDSSGSATTAKLNGSASGSYWSYGSTAAPAGNTKMASGELVNSWPSSPTMTVSSIPYAKYNVYIYAGIDATGRNQTVSLTPSGGMAQYYSFTTEVGGSTWTQATSTWNGSGTAPSLPSANYVEFTGLTASSFTLAWGAPGNGGMNGFQIVPSN